MAVILLVEDEQDFSNLVRRSLESDGHQVMQAFTGPEGLRVAEATPGPAGSRGTGRQPDRPRSTE